MTLTQARFILGLPPAFTPRDLKRAYRRAAAANHPDCGGKVERMVLVNEAYAVLLGRPGAEPRTERRYEPHPWTTPEPEGFRRESDSAPPDPEHPLEHYVRVAAGVIALAVWITGMIDAINDFQALRVWMLLGLPISYLVVLWPVRCVVRVGIRIYSFTVRVRARIAPLRS